MAHCSFSLIILQFNQKLDEAGFRGELRQNYWIMKRRGIRVLSCLGAAHLGELILNCLSCLGAYNFSLVWRIGGLVGQYHQLTKKWVWQASDVTSSWGGSGKTCKDVILRQRDSTFFFS